MQNESTVKVKEFEKWLLTAGAFAISRTLSCPFDNYKLISQSYFIPQHFLPLSSDQPEICIFCVSTLLAGNGIVLCQYFIVNLFWYILNPVYITLYTSSVGDKCCDIMKTIVLCCIVVLPIIMNLHFNYFKVNSVIHFDTNAFKIEQINDATKFYNCFFSYILLIYVQQQLIDFPIKSSFIQCILLSMTYPLDAFKTRQMVTGEHMFNIVKVSRCIMKIVYL